MKISIKANILALVLAAFISHLSNAQFRCDLENVRLSIISIDGATIVQGTSFIDDADRNGLESTGSSLEITGLGCGLITMEVELEYFWKQGILDDAWIHGVSFVPSSGWLSSEAGELPDGWDFYDSVTGDCSGQTYYDGYFYDECDSLDYGGARCSCGGLECDPCNSPNDNYGFNCSGNNCPKFRFSLTYCPSGTQTFDETISFNITNDGNSGSWNRASSCYYLVSYPVRINSSGTEPPDSIVWLSDLPQDIFISCQGSIPSPDSLLFGAASGCINSAYVQATVLDSIESKNKLIYTWNVETPCGEKLFHQQSIYVQEQELHVLGNSIICPSDSTELSIDYIGISTLWNTGETSNAIMISDSGTYSVSVTYSDGCILQDTFTLSHFSSPQAMLIGDTELCENESTSIMLNEQFVTYVWSTNETSPSIIVGETDNYVVTVTDTNSCTTSAELLVTVHPLPTVNIQGDNYFCEGDSTSLNLTQSYNQIIWSNTSEQSLVYISEAGIYQVTVYDNFNCSATSSIEVLELSNPSPMIIGDNQLCEEGTSTLSIQDSYESVTWNTGSTLPEISITTDGDYSITVIDSLGCEGSDTLSVELIPAPIAEVDSVYCYSTGTYAVAFTSNTSNIENSLGLDITATQENQYLITDIDTSNSISLVLGTTDCPLEINIQAPNCSNPVNEKSESALYLPNIFSPNNDGVNDALNLVSNRKILVKEVAIFNRWGNVMNSSKDIQLVAGEHTNIWDGTYKGDRVQPGVYVVYVEYLDAKGAQQYLISDVTVVY